MFEEVLSKEALRAIDQLAPVLNEFYLAGGTGLALQLGHRRSDDLDFFSHRFFNQDLILRSIQYDEVILVEAGTVHCIVGGIRISLLYYSQPLLYTPLRWRGILVADIRDIAAEKLKTVSQRGAKKDFVDLYAILKMRHSIPEVCEFFINRFKERDVNLYHVLKSLVFFEDADQEPSPSMLVEGKEWEWENIKAFFLEGLEEFERALTG